MTNNIEKLYKLAKVEKKSHCDYTCNSRYLCSTNCTHYNEKIEEFPPFTESKQLKIIKLISSEFTVRINSNKDSTFIMLMQSAKTFLWASDDKFEQALAKLVCELWEYLKQEAKQEIKRILE